MKSTNILATLNAYLPNNTRSYGTKTNTWKYLQAKATKLLALCDGHAEELSFPSIYVGQARTFKTSVKVTPFMMETSETRCKYRRGVTTQHIVYMAMKILLLRVSEGLYATFRCVGETEK
jgi:hypothetical protein